MNRPIDSQSLSFDREIFEKELTLLSKKQLPPNWSWVKSSVNANVAFNSKISIYYKEFLPRDRWEKIKALVRGSRCDRAITMARTLTDLGFRTPKVIDSGKIDRQRDYLITEAVNAVGVASYLASYLRQPQSGKAVNWKRKVIFALGQEIGRLHNKGIIHGDLRPNNVLVELGNRSPTFHFIDNERSRLWRSNPPEKLIKKNLIQIGMLYPIDISRTDRLRFFKAYSQQYNRFGNCDESRSFLRSIYSATISRLVSTTHYKPQKPNLPQSAMEKGLVVPDEID